MLFKTGFTVAAVFFSNAAAQTYSSCNPLYSTGCPADTALGKSISVDFTKGSVNSFTAEGNPTYDSSGVHFTVAKTGDAPTLSSVFYIMFGKVSISMKCAPGAGIVSSVVLESDDLDEIDLEWVGPDSAQVQTNYFGKGDVTPAGRGAFNPAPNNQAQFITYTVEWTESQIVWSVGGSVVRVLTPATAAANQYPQSPMRVKFGAWSGGDPSNPPGTIAWAQGPTDYSKGPFTMTVQNIQITDYSTGTQYKYGDTSGSWGSIKAIGGAVNGNKNGASSPVATAASPAVTSASPSIPAGIGSSHGSTSTLTGWPWVATTTLSTVTQASSAAGIPSGWVITASGKVVPASAAVSSTSTLSSSAGPLPSPFLPPSVPGSETITGWDDRGFPTTRTILMNSAITTGWDINGFPTTRTILPGFATTSAPQHPVASQISCVGSNCGINDKIVATSTSSAGASKETFRFLSVVGVAAFIAVGGALL